MPYRYAHYYVLALIPASIVGFWNGYFSVLAAADPILHLHGLTATAWIFLLAGQSWAIHNRRIVLHRRLGRLSLFIFPLFFAGFFLVFQTEGRSVIAGNPYRAFFAPGIGVLTLIAIVVIGWFYYAALRNRRTVHLHARYLLAIPFLFAESIFGRILNVYTPGLIVNSIDDVRNIYWATHLSQLAAIIFAMALYFQDRKYGAPFLIVSAAMVLQSIGLEVFDGMNWWRDIFLALAVLPSAPVFAAALAGGALIVWAGWTAGGDNGTVRRPA